MYLCSVINTPNHMEELKKQHLYQSRELTTEQLNENQQTAHEVEELVCPHCGTINDPESLFCEECGSALAHKRLCPNCHQPLDLLADFCEHCKTYVCNFRCSFCGAEVAETDAFCPECGAAREGIVCPACHTRSPFSYCRVCGMPLTDEAQRQSQMMHEEPMWKKMDAIALELENLMKIKPAETAQQLTQNQKNEELCRRVRELLGRPITTDGLHEITLRQGETSEKIAERIAAKRKELQEMLDATAAQPQENPILTRNFVMARKPTSARVGWKCNFKHVIHSSPCGCACPQMGGKWVVLEKDSKVEDDI